MAIYLHRLGVFLLSQCQMMRARTEFSLKMLTTFLILKLRLKSKRKTGERESDKEREIDRERDWADLCAVLKVGELLYD